MTIDLGAVQAGQVSYTDLMRNVGHADLYEMTDELFDVVELLLAGLTDAAVLFVPHDPAASDQSEQGWTLSHIIAHLTATLEEAATIATLLARNVQVEERLRSETPWQKLSTFQQVQARLQESRRTCRAFLDAWPDKPHLDVTRTLIPLFGPMDAISFVRRYVNTLFLRISRRSILGSAITSCSHQAWANPPARSSAQA